jgi:AcrR family transcriptional regulator
MAQVRKEEVRKRILKSADKLFEEKGYVGTTLNAIAKDSNTSIGSIYVYFSSKLELFFALYGPWLKKKLIALDKAASKHKSAHEKLEHILRGIWYDIPVARRGFTNNFILAIAAAQRHEFSGELYRWCSDKLMSMVIETLPQHRRSMLKGNELADILFMAFDGYAINYKLGFTRARAYEASRLMAAILMGE